MIAVDGSAVVIGHQLGAHIARELRAVDAGHVRQANLAITLGRQRGAIRRRYRVGSDDSVVLTALLATIVHDGIPCQHTIEDVSRSLSCKSLRSRILLVLPEARRATVNTADSTRTSISDNILVPQHGLTRLGAQEILVDSLQETVKGIATQRFEEVKDLFLAAVFPVGRIVQNNRHRIIAPLVERTLKGVYRALAQRIVTVERLGGAGRTLQYDLDLFAATIYHLHTALAVHRQRLVCLKYVVDNLGLYRPTGRTPSAIPNF